MVTVRATAIHAMGMLAKLSMKATAGMERETVQSASLAVTPEGIAASPDATEQGDSLAAASVEMQAFPDAAEQDEDLAAAPGGM
jgi:hypothetical protein